MPLQLSPVVDADIEAVIAVDITAFSDDIIHAAIWRNGPSPTTIAHTAAQDRKDLAEEPTIKPMKVTDTETGEIVAYARWVFLPQREEKDLEVTEFSLPDDVNKELGEKLILGGFRKRHEVMGTQPYACKCTLFLGSKAANRSELKLPL
jgi:hypothetical protein